MSIAWAEATISIAQEPLTYQGFFFNSSGLQYNNSVGGWIGKFFLPNESVGSCSDLLDSLRLVAPRCTSIVQRRRLHLQHYHPELLLQSSGPAGRHLSLCDLLD